MERGLLVAPFRVVSANLKAPDHDGGDAVLPIHPVLCWHGTWRSAPQKPGGGNEVIGINCSCQCWGWRCRPFARRHGAPTPAQSWEVVALAVV